jgi:DNA-binding response OmpR family regulator
LVAPVLHLHQLLRDRIGAEGSHMYALLLVGEDPMVQWTRAAVLRKTGADIYCANSASALEVQTARMCDVVVLCHSLRSDLVDWLAERIRAGWPEAGILLVTRDRLAGEVEKNRTVDVISPYDPERLIARTMGLLRRQSLAKGHAGANHAEGGSGGSGQASKLDPKLLGQDGMDGLLQAS